METKIKIGKYNLKFSSNIEYSVDEKHGVVRCRIEFRIPAIASLFLKVDNEDYCDHFIIYGTAKCNENDTFDVNKGKLIARCRAQMKATTIEIAIRRKLGKLLKLMREDNQAKHAKTANFKTKTRSLLEKYGK